MKKLIINADDFGYSYIFNKSILDLLKEESIYSTTVMVNWITENQKDQIADLIQIFQHGRVSVGLHIEKVSDNVSDDIKNQVDTFKVMFDFMPTHFDIHKPSKTEASIVHIQKPVKNTVCLVDLYQKIASINILQTILQ